MSTKGNGSTEIVVRETSSMALMPVLAIEEAIERRAAIVQYTKELMVEGKDFGPIPGTDKNTLLKPGAEKLTSLFGLTPRFEIVRSEEDWTGERHNGEPFFYYLIRCSLWRGEQQAGEGDGSCNSWEKKYRWRKAERICPNCGAANIRKSKKDNGWYCWAQTGGCGGNFKGNDTRITEQETGNIPNPDICDLTNTILKMAEKRALVAATLIAVNASEFFTQDLEDFIEVHPTVVVEAAPQLQPEPSPAYKEALLKAREQVQACIEAIRNQPHMGPGLDSRTDDQTRRELISATKKAGWEDYPEEHLPSIVETLLPGVKAAKLTVAQTAGLRNWLKQEIETGFPLISIIWPA